MAPVFSSWGESVDAPFAARVECVKTGSKPDSRRWVRERVVPEVLARSLGGDTSDGCRLSAAEGGESGRGIDCASGERVNGHGDRPTPAGNAEERAAAGCSPERSASGDVIRMSEGSAQWIDADVAIAVECVGTGAGTAVG